MSEIKEAFKLAWQSDSKLRVGLIRQRGQEFDVANQMSQKELLKPTGVFDVGGKEVGDQRPFEGFAQDFL